MIEQNAITENKEDVNKLINIEVWFDLIGFEGLYMISQKGNIYSIKNKIKLKSFLNTKGYPSVSLKRKTYAIHRLMAESFLPKIKGKDMVNHIDGNKQNNHICNLEWVNNRENILHYYNSEFSGIQKTKANKYSVKIQYNNKQIYLGTYKRISDARIAYLTAKQNYDGINN
jgi:hypothetical protein